jgi:5-methylcytosine-specific restriction endonuclease McrA
LFTANWPQPEYCSDECRYERQKEQHRHKYLRDWQPKALVCKACGKEYAPKFGDKGKWYCSPTCKRLARRSDEPRSKAKRNGVYYEPVNPLKVFKRDSWRCQLCGKKLKPNHRGTMRDDAPELDHIIPWAQGGEHSYRNTQCACRKCNSEKGSRELGQLRLFG